MNKRVPFPGFRYIKGISRVKVFGRDIGKLVTDLGV